MIKTQARCHNYLGIALGICFFQKTHLNWNQSQLLTISSTQPSPTRLQPDIYSCYSFCYKRTNQAHSGKYAFRYEYKCMNLQWSLGYSFCPGKTWLDLGWCRCLYSVLLLVVAHTGLDCLLCWAPPSMSLATRRRQHQAWKARIIHSNRFSRTALETEPVQKCIHIYDMTSVLINVYYIFK